MNQYTDMLTVRQRHLGRGVGLSYRDPLTLVRGEGAYLYDAGGNAYLDCINNVNHVGHCHPHVVAAAAEQMARLNTNTRYLHPTLSQYLTKLLDHFPEPLSICYLVNSGSEATELALQLARNYTQAEDLMVLGSGYHGHTAAALAMGEYRFAGPGGQGCPANTHVAPLPCRYRGQHRQAPDPGKAYANDVVKMVDALKANNTPLAGFLCEIMLSVGGQVIVPEGYLAPVYAAVRNAGGVCIADEVQTGFGRPGQTFWSFELQDAIPDIVTLGKPIGNGHPMGAVITTPAIAEAFDNGMEYFNTFGGNPVSCATGLAVLEVIEQEQLQHHALILGRELLDELTSLQEKYPVIGDVRGQGLFIGIELVRNRETLEPADKEANELMERMKERGVLLSVEGALHNVIKFKPPMVFSSDDGARFLECLDAVLASM